MSQFSTGWKRRENYTLVFTFQYVLQFDELELHDVLNKPILIIWIYGDFLILFQFRDQSPIRPLSRIFYTLLYIIMEEFEFGFDSSEMSNLLQTILLSPLLTQHIVRFAGPESSITVSSPVPFRFPRRLDVFLGKRVCPIEK